MVKGDKKADPIKADVKVKEVSSIQINDKQHPEVMEGINSFAKLVERRPHDAVRLFFKNTKSKMPQILKYCREELQIAI